ncbi:hypothetical protein M8J76_014199 [Diaphorina citri]|nr:hypothetical protein M8J76_005994 [Diaphorina citri]KAI5719750.1 hypothetical protein M8J76_014199 [Diaphorina citri]
MPLSDFDFPFADCSLSSSLLSPEPADVHSVSPPSTSAILTEHLGAFPGKCSIAHLNAHSMRPPNKFYELENIFLGSGCDIICVTESWLDSSISDSEISMLGYRVIRNDRVTREAFLLMVNFQLAVLITTWST